MTTQRKNIGNEQFFTQAQTANRLIGFLKSQVWFKNVTRIIEPSAGDGVWLEKIQVDLAFDIEPKHPDVQKADYLQVEVPYQEGTLILGNPPFGRMGTLAVDFFNRAAEQGDWIAFILPASFGKRTLQRRLNKHFHLLHQEEMLDEKFRYEREGKVVKCVFQVWERRPHMRVETAPKRSTRDFEFVRVSSPPSGKALPPPDKADLAIRTHGHGYGKTFLRNDPKWMSLNTRTHRFIRTHVNVDEVRNRLSKIDWKEVGKFTVGQPCVSTEEIVELYEETYKTT
jgi:hypothetical protein